MKLLWISVSALALFSAEFSALTGTLLDDNKPSLLDALARIDQRSSPHAYILLIAKPHESGLWSEYVHLHRTRLDSPMQRALIDNCKDQ